MLTRPLRGGPAHRRYRGAVIAVVSSIAALAAASVVIGVLQGPLGVPNASSVYLVAVVVCGVLFGTWPAVVTAILAFLFFDFLFVEPVYTFAVADAGEWLNLLVFLLVAVVIGRLTTLQTERADDANRRASESQALFAISRTLATATTVAEAAPTVLARLAADSGMDRIWFATRTAAGERTVVDSAPDEPRPRAPIHWMMQRTPGDEPARWVRAHVGSEPGRTPKAATDALFRVKVEADGEVLGSLWASRALRAGLPGREETRLLALAADQLGLALRRDALTAESTAAEIARQSDALKSALLTSVSHDLRTPLSSIRAAAGSLLDPAITWSPEDQRSIARSIDTEAERLNRLVRNLLDLSRIEGGALRPDLEVFELDELLEPILARLAPALVGRRVEVAVPSDLPPVRVDAVYLDEAVSNLLENAGKYTGPDASIRITARLAEPSAVDLTIEDSGNGVPAGALPHLFEKFYRVPRAGEGSRRGMGIGLSVVKGLVEAMGGRVAARMSALGGLAVDLRLVSVPAPVIEVEG